MFTHELIIDQNNAGRHILSHSSMKIVPGLLVHQTVNQPIIVLPYTHVDSFLMSYVQFQNL